MRAFHMLSIFRGFQMTCKPILHLSIFSCLDALFWKTKNFGGTFVFLRRFLRLSKKFFPELKTTHRTLNERTIFFRCEKKGGSICYGKLQSCENVADGACLNIRTFCDRDPDITTTLLSNVNVFRSRTFFKSKSLKCARKGSALNLASKAKITLGLGFRNYQFWFRRGAFHNRNISNKGIGFIKSPIPGAST